MCPLCKLTTSDCPVSVVLILATVKPYEACRVRIYFLGEVGVFIYSL